MMRARALWLIAYAVICALQFLLTLAKEYVEKQIKAPEEKKPEPEPDP